MLIYATADKEKSNAKFTKALVSLSSISFKCLNASLTVEVIFSVCNSLNELKVSPFSGLSLYLSSSICFTSAIDNTCFKVITSSIAAKCSQLYFLEIGADTTSPLT